MFPPSDYLIDDWDRFLSSLRAGAHYKHFGRGGSSAGAVLLWGRLFGRGGSSTGAVLRLRDSMKPWTTWGRATRGSLAQSSTVWHWLLALDLQQTSSQLGVEQRARQIMRTCLLASHPFTLGIIGLSGKKVFCFIVQGTTHLNWFVAFTFIRVVGLRRKTVSNTWQG